MISNSILTLSLAGLSPARTTSEPDRTGRRSRETTARELTSWFLENSEVREATAVAEGARMAAMVKNAWETLGSSGREGLPKLKSRAWACGRARQVVHRAGRADNYLKLSCFLDKCIFGSG